MIRFCLVLATLFIVARGAQAGPQYPSAKAIAAFTGLALKLRDVETGYSEEGTWLGGPVQLKSQRAKDDLAKIDWNEIGHASYGKDCFAYFVAALEIRAGRTELAKQHLLPLTGKRDVALEAAHALADLDWGVSAIKNRSKYVHVLARMAPVSVYGIMDDEAHLHRTSMAEQPTIPELSPPGTTPNLIDVATDFDKAGMTQYASNAYREAIHGAIGPPQLYVYQRECWLSNATAPLWLNLARCEWTLGHADTAFNCLANAIIYGQEDTKNQALAALAAWKNPHLTQHNGDKIGDRNQAIINIVDQYTRMHLHPRAYELLVAEKASLGLNASQRIQDLEQDWSTLLKGYCQGGEPPYTLFGQIVAPDTPLSEIVIPTVATPNALALASREVAALNK